MWVFLCLLRFAFFCPNQGFNRHSVSPIINCVLHILFNFGMCLPLTIVVGSVICGLGRVQERIIGLGFGRAQVLKFTSLIHPPRKAPAPAITSHILVRIHFGSRQHKSLSQPPSTRYCSGNDGVQQALPPNLLGMCFSHPKWFASQLGHGWTGKRTISRKSMVGPVGCHAPEPNQTCDFLAREDAL